MSHQKSNSGLFWGAILILIGVLFLLDNFYYIDFGDIIATYWPLILVAIGIKIIMDKRRDKDIIDDINSGEQESTTFGSSGTDFVSESNIFGDINLKLTSGKFRGGSINNVFGDIKLDISEVKLAEGVTRISISGVFGDITLVTPKDIPLTLRGSAVAGDIAARGNKKDGLFPNMNYSDRGYEQAKSRLDIRSSIVFGSITVF